MLANFLQLMPISQWHWNSRGQVNSRDKFKLHIIFVQFCWIPLLYVISSYFILESSVTEGA